MWVGGLLGDSLGGDGDPEDGAQRQVVDADAGDLAAKVKVGAVDAHGERDDEQHDTHADVDHRVLHLLGDEDQSTVEHRVIQ